MAGSGRHTSDKGCIGDMEKYNSATMMGFTVQNKLSQIFLQRIERQYHLNQGMTAEQICLSTNAHIALKQFIGNTGCG